MKRLFLILCCALTAWQLHAQFAAIAAYAPKYSPGKVWFQDGHSEEFAAVETPNCMQKKLTVSHDEKRKEKKTINVADITAVTLWHKDHPDKTFTLVHILTQTSMVNMVPDQWGFPIAQSAWGMAIRCYPSYQFQKKSGELEGILLSQTSSNGMVNRQPILTFLYRPNVEKSILLASDGTFMPKAKECFSDNETIYAALKARKLRLTDMQYILDEMAGGASSPSDDQEASSPSEQPQAIEETVQNGTVGDDE